MGATSDSAERNVGIRRATIGVDIGGTFTDAVAIGHDGRVHTGKAPTTPGDLATGVMDAIAVAAEAIGLSPEELLVRTDLVKHGSTVATNALITRAGARVGLITTRGFEDTLAIMRSVGRVDGLPEEEVRHVAAITKPAPLVPSERIRGVRERIDAHGVVVVPLDPEEAVRAARSLVEDEGVDAIAISFLHSWVNPGHERAAQSAIEAVFPREHLHQSLGSELSAIAGEYARTNTAVADAFVGPLVERYLDDLARRLQGAGFTGQLLIMQGNGGLTAPRQASPISTLQSGPAGGMMAAAHVGAEQGHPLIITTDMGGTSFDVGLVHAGQWRYAEEPIFERMRILQPIIDVRSIGAGGGTIARVDAATGRLVVGPESAGADPGPVCYGRGGTEPTVTDCDLVLGVIDPAFFLGGRRLLDLEAARRAIDERLAQPLGMTIDDAAAGVVRVINSHMADLIRREVVRTGRHPEDYALYSFGGAGPMHAVGVGREIGVRQIHVVPASAVLSAFGIAMADLVHTRVATRFMPMPVDPAELNAVLDGMEAGLRRQLADDGYDGQPVFRRYLTMRFRRQTVGEELDLPWDRANPERIGLLEDLFVERYEELYGAGAAYRDAGLDVSAVRVDAIGRVPRPDLLREEPGDASNATARKGARRVWFEDAWHTATIFDAMRLRSGMRVAGPAIVEAPFTTTALPPGSEAVVDSLGSLVVTV